MSNVQQLNYDGWLADDPVMRYLANGTPVTNFRIGSSRSYKTKNGDQKKETTWLKVAVWGNQAEYINEHTRKGTRVFVEGRLRPAENGSPEIFTLNNGNPAASYEVTARNVTILEGGVWDSQSEEDEPEEW